MTAPIPLRAYATSGLVSEATVNALPAFGEPMVTEMIQWPEFPRRQYRAWIRYRPGCQWPSNNLQRVMGHPWHSTPQFAATALLEKLEGRR